MSRRSRKQNRSSSGNKASQSLPNGSAWKAWGDHPAVVALIVFATLLAILTGIISLRGGFGDGTVPAPIDVAPGQDSPLIAGNNVMSGTNNGLISGNNIMTGTNSELVTGNNIMSGTNNLLVTGNNIVSGTNITAITGNNTISGTNNTATVQIESVGNGNYIGPPKPTPLPGP